MLIPAVFPEVVSFGTGWMMTLAYLIVCPYEAVAIGRVGSYVFPQLNTLELYRVGGHPVYLPHVVAGLALTPVIVLVNYRGVHISARFQSRPANPSRGATIPYAPPLKCSRYSTP